MHYKLLRSKSNNMSESLNKVEIPFHLRLENSLKGWENADAIGLDRIGQRVGKLFKSLTCRKVLNNYDEFGRKWSNKVYEENEKKEVVELFEKIGSYDIPIIEIVRKLRDNIFASQDWKESNEIELMLNKILDLRLGASFYNWIEHNLKTNNQPELQAKVVYLATSIENPFIFINEDVKKTAETTYINVQKTGNSLDPQKKEVTTARFSTFLNETRYGANCKELNAWGYADQACEETLELIDNPSITKKLVEVSYRFKSDLLLFCQNQKCYPPQIFFILYYIKKLYSKSTNYIEALVAFYEENPDGLYKYFDGKLNFVVSGMNRVYEKLDVISALNAENQGGVFLSLFSGPPSISKKEAELTGCSECITVDRRPKNELKSIKSGGKALLLKNELLPGQDPNKVLIEDPLSNIEHLHINGSLPDDNLLVEKMIKGKNISVITDKRGSGLYLEGQKKLDYLEWLFKLGQKHPGVIINYDTGVPNWLYVNLVLKGNSQGGFDVKDYFSGLNIGEKFKSYIGYDGQLNTLYNGFEKSTVPDRDEIAKLIPMHLSEDEIEEYRGLTIPVMNEIIEAFYYIVNPSDLFFKDRSLFLPTSKEIIYYFQSIVSGHYDQAKSFIKQAKMNVLHKKILENINPEVFHRIIYLFASKASVSISREALFYPQLCHPIQFKINADDQDQPIIGKNIRLPKRPSGPKILKNLKMARKILYQEFKLKIPPQINTFIKDGGVTLFKDMTDYENGSYDRDSLFLLYDSLTTFDLFEEKRGEYNFLAFRIASVVKCQDGIERIIAINYKKTEKGWVATGFDISANGFSKNIMNDHNLLYAESFPTPTGHPLYTAALVTPEMVRAVHDQLAGRSLSFATLDSLNDYDSLQRLTNYHLYHFKIVIDDENNNHIFKCDDQTIFTFPSRFKG